MGAAGEEVGGHGIFQNIAPLFQKPCKLCKAFTLGKRLTAGEGDTPAKGIAADDFHKDLFRHGGTAAKVPGFGIVAAFTVMGTALAENGGADAGAVYNTVTDDAA